MWKIFIHNISPTIHWAISSALLATDSSSWHSCTSGQRWRWCRWTPWPHRAGWGGRTQCRRWWHHHLNKADLSKKGFHPCSHPGRAWGGKQVLLVGLVAYGVHGEAWELVGFILLRGFSINGQHFIKGSLQNLSRVKLGKIYQKAKWG